MPTQESTLVRWCQSSTRLQQGQEVKSCAAKIYRTYYNTVLVPVIFVFACRVLSLKCMLVDLARSIYQYLVLRRPFKVTSQQIFLTNFSYFILPRKCGNIYLTYAYLKTVLIRIFKWSERRGPETFPVSRRRNDAHGKHQKWFLII